MKQLVQWLDMAINEPSIKMQQALVITGPTGNGKSIFAKLLERELRIDDESRKIVWVEKATQGRALYSRFYGAALVVIENVRADNIEHVKNAIIQPQLTFEAKGKDLITFDNKARVLITQSHWAAAKDDRRFIIATPFQAMTALTEV